MTVFDVPILDRLTPEQLELILQLRATGITTRDVDERIPHCKFRRALVEYGRRKHVQCEREDMFDQISHTVRLLYYINVLENV
ncbi:hypothetical protein AAVH_36374 [Aphelenchoides avenae]|nr:hypothetical protein AAVH_36374 [Aphelenchus avenae]